MTKDNKCSILEVDVGDNWDGQEISELHTDDADDGVSIFVSVVLFKMSFLLSCIFCFTASCMHRTCFETFALPYLDTKTL